MTQAFLEKFSDLDLTFKAESSCGIDSVSLSKNSAEHHLCCTISDHVYFVVMTKYLKQASLRKKNLAHSLEVKSANSMPWALVNPRPSPQLNGEWQ